LEAGEMDFTTNVYQRKRSFFLVSCLMFLLFLFVPGFLLASFAQAAIPASITKVNSTFFAGYIISSPVGATKLIEGNWVVPQLVCTTGENANSAYFVNIDGDAAGAFFDCNSGAPQYSPLFTFESIYGLIPSTDTVSAGDKMQAIITISSTHVAKITLKDITKSWVFTFTGTDTSNTQNFAFWALESGPAETGTPNPDFGTFKTSSNIATIGTHHGSLSTFASIAADPIQRDTLVDTSSHVLASISSLSGSGSSFSIKWVASS
jgi:hypothetical protein